MFVLQVTIQGEWVLWQSKVPQIEVETHKVAAPDVVVPTVDTVRHEALLYTWLAEHKPMVLCGPPGSGKTMTLFSALRALPDMEVSFLISYLVYFMLLLRFYRRTGPFKDKIRKSVFDLVNRLDQTPLKRFYL